MCVTSGTISTALVSLQHQKQLFVSLVLVLNTEFLQVIYISCILYSLAVNLPNCVYI